MIDWIAVGVFFIKVSNISYKEIEKQKVKIVYEMWDFVFTFAPNLKTTLALYPNLIHMKVQNCPRQSLSGI